MPLRHLGRKKPSSKNNYPTQTKVLSSSLRQRPISTTRKTHLVFKQLIYYYETSLKLTLHLLLLLNIFPLSYIYPWQIHGSMELNEDVDLGEAFSFKSIVIKLQTLVWFCGKWVSPLNILCYI